MSNHPALQVIDLLRSWAEDDFPGCVLSTDLFDASLDMAGFVISVGDGLALVMTDVTGNATGPWAIQAGGGLALDVPDLSGPLAWVNSRNRASVYGRYFCGLAEAQAMSAIAYVDFFHGVFFEYLQQGSMARWLRALVRNVAQTAAEEGGQLVAAYGGRTFEPNQQDLIVLFTLMGS